MRTTAVALALAVAGLAAAVSTPARPLAHDTKIRGSAKLVKKVGAQTLVRITLRNGERQPIDHGEVEALGGRFTRLMGVRTLARASAPKVRLRGGKIEVTGVPGLSTLTFEALASGGAIRGVFVIDKLRGRGNVGSLLLVWGRYDLAVEIEPAKALYHDGQAFWSPAAPVLRVTNTRAADGGSPFAEAVVSIRGLSGWTLRCGDGMPSANEVRIRVPRLAPGASIRCVFAVDARGPLAELATVTVHLEPRCSRVEEKNCSNNRFPRLTGAAATFDLGD